MAEIVQNASLGTRRKLELLLQEMDVIQGKLLANLEFLHAAKPFWHTRTINCLARKDCPPLQSATERKYIILKVR